MSFGYGPSYLNQPDTTEQVPVAPKQAEQWGDPEARYKNSKYPREVDQPPVDPETAYEVGERLSDAGSRTGQLINELREFMQQQSVSAQLLKML